jgi:hypothetical protein
MTIFLNTLYIGHFTGDNEPEGIEMQPTIHLQSKPGLDVENNCIFNTVGLIITH